MDSEKISHLNGLKLGYTVCYECHTREYGKVVAVTTGRYLSPRTVFVECVTGISMSEQSNSPQDKPSDPNEPRLYPEDQARVDEFLKRGVNSVERKPFRPVFLVFLLIAVVTGFSLLSQVIARWAGVY